MGWASSSISPSLQQVNSDADGQPVTLLTVVTRQLLQNLEKILLVQETVFPIFLHFFYYLGTILGAFHTKFRVFKSFVT
jgi:hypothetical protein